MREKKETDRKRGRERARERKIERERERERENDRRKESGRERETEGEEERERERETREIHEHGSFFKVKLGSTVLVFHYHNFTRSLPHLLCLRRLQINIYI